MFRGGAESFSGSGCFLVLKALTRPRLAVGAENQLRYQSRTSGRKSVEVLVLQMPPLMIAESNRDGITLAESLDIFLADG